jgi:hypothetical protein
VADLFSLIFQQRDVCPMQTADLVLASLLNLAEDRCSSRTGGPASCTCSSRRCSRAAAVWSRR